MSENSHEKPHAAGTLAGTAAAIGAALGTIASRTGLAHPDKPERRIKGKFVSQQKHRLPRKEKKRLQASPEAHE